MSKVSKHQHSRQKKHQRRLPPAFYLDEGMPAVAHVLRRVGFRAVTAEEVFGGGGVDDRDHLAVARQEGLVFVTRDGNRAKYELEAGRLQDSPGILVLRSQSGDQLDLLMLVGTFLRYFPRAHRMHERVVTVSRDKVRCRNKDGFTVLQRWIG
jgi:uncharacterized protein with PIN domain